MPGDHWEISALRLWMCLLGVFVGYFAAHFVLPRRRDQTRFYRVYSVEGMTLAYGHHGRPGSPAGANIVASEIEDGVLSTDKSDCW